MSQSKIIFFFVCMSYHPMAHSKDVHSTKTTIFGKKLKARPALIGTGLLGMSLLAMTYAVLESRQNKNPNNKLPSDTEANNDNDNNNHNDDSTTSPLSSSSQTQNTLIPQNIELGFKTLLEKAKSAHITTKNSEWNEATKDLKESLQKHESKEEVKKWIHIFFESLHLKEEKKLFARGLIFLYLQHDLNIFDKDKLLSYVYWSGLNFPV